MNMCVCVFQSIRVSRMVFLGAVDYGALRTECMKRDQVRETLDSPQLVASGPIG